MDREDLDKLAAVVNNFNSIPVAGRNNQVLMVNGIAAIEGIILKYLQQKQDQEQEKQEE